MARSVPIAEVFPRGSARGGLLVDCWEAAPRFTALLPRHFRDPSAFADQAKELDGRPLDRRALQVILTSQNEEIAALPAAMAQIARITDPRAVVVIGGQQAGLFSGPLYTIHKAVTVLRLSADLEAELGRPVIPVFWIAAEDSDVAEVDHAVILDQAGELREVSLRREGDPGGGPGGSAGKPPVSALRFGPEVGEAVAALATALPEGAFAQEMLEGVRTAYAPGRSYPQAFGRLMAWLFSGQGLVLVDPSDPRLKSMALPLFRREIEEKGPVSAAVREQSERLVAAGYAPQIELRDGMLTLFHQDPGREAIALQGDGYVLKGSGRVMTGRELAALLEDEPGLFTPNAALRPLFQDTVFPTLAAVLGPSELAYFTQLTLAYQRMGVPMPILFPRASVTLLEAKAARTLDKLGLSLRDVLVRGDALVEEVLRREIPADLRAGIETGRTRVSGIWSDLTQRIARLDPTLGPTAELAAAASMKQFDFIEKKITQAAKKRDEILRGQVGRLTASLFPRGGLQERTLNVVPFLARYGMRLLEEQARALDVREPLHHCMEIQP